MNEVSHTAGQGLSDGKPPEVKRLVAGLSQAVAATPGVRAAFLFGSCWEGSTWAESDVDLAVMFEPGLDSSMRLAAEKRLLEQAEKVLGAVGERLDIADLEYADSAVAFRAISRGVCVWSRTDADRVETIVRVARRYDDESAMRRLFREAAKASVRRLKGAHG